jgi:gluconate 2-dehydrogenase gamma chain
MSNLLWSRRTFLVRSAIGVGGAVAASVSPSVLFALHKHAREAAARGGELQFLSKDEAADLKAFAAQVIPTTDTPGANEANIVYFIDRALVEIEPDSQPAIRAALQQLDDFARKSSTTPARFAALTSDDQMKVISALEKLPSPPRADMLGSFYGVGSNSFDLLRSMVLAAFLSDPELGGNTDGVGWNLIGFDAMPMHEPPFGYYDAELLKAEAKK